ncbi:uncharacterized protein PAC_03426 [Phialocephala subalpina]|uniref:Uncharacterized protein n=1 Tax=Phialocephala subalpina TaxID=576137 RepID=A0A1L7WL95_9HELO|nr:uncharacterized protein PAC_03426 [Phialocephala subalpina]
MSNSAGLGDTPEVAYHLTTPLTVRTYEVLSLALFLGGCVYVWRSKNPVYVGIYLASSIGGGIFEWIFDSKYYFRLTADNRFISAWTMAGEKAPAAMILIYGFFFGIPLVLLRQYKAVLYQRAGNTGIYCLIFSLGFFGTPAFECTNTTVTKIYKYHQRDEYLFYGMPYSNFWFGVLMMGLPYWGLEQAEALTTLIPRTMLSRSRQKLLAASVGFSTVITAFFIAATLNGIWYATAGDIWTETPRAF